MDETLKKILFKKYPEILKKENLISDIECGNGWFGLVMILCQTICNHLKCSPNSQLEINKHPHPCVVRIKQKFAGLRFYVENASPEIYGMISLAEQLSFYICEKCGSVDDVTQTKEFLIQSLCKKCRLELKNVNLNDE